MQKLSNMLGFDPYFCLIFYIYEDLVLNAFLHSASEYRFSSFRLRVDDEEHVPCLLWR